MPKKSTTKKGRQRATEAQRIADRELVPWCENRFLLQGLTQLPHVLVAQKQAVAYAFGGGMLGLSPELRAVLDKLFMIDYMGAAEFEFGALPDCASKMHRDREWFRVRKMTFRESSVRPLSTYQLDKKVTLNSTAEREVFLLAREEHLDPMEDMYRRLFGKGPQYIGSFKRYPGHVHEYLAGKVFKEDQAPVGLLDLNNGAFLFLDEGVLQRTCKAFGFPYEG